MIKLYLIVLSEQFDRAEVLKYFDSVPQYINFWFISLPSSIFVKTALKAEALKDLIQGKFESGNYIFIIEVAKHINYAATVPDEHAEFFREYSTYSKKIP